MVVVGLLVLTACGSTASTTKISSAPMAQSTSYDMNGTWNQTNTTSKAFTAVIHDTTIEIDIDGDDTQAVYWIGSVGGGSINNTPTTGQWVSQADEAAMADDLLASQDKTKTFTFDAKTHQLSFEFSMMGVSGTVTMEKSSE
jgi:hypothetical protein